MKGQFWQKCQNFFYDDEIEYHRILIVFYQFIVEIYPLKNVFYGYWEEEKLFEQLENEKWIDLHGQTRKSVKDMIKYLSQEENYQCVRTKILNNPMTNRKQKETIIEQNILIVAFMTGRGNHSPNGEPVLLPFIMENYETRKCFKYDEEDQIRVVIRT